MTSPLLALPGAVPPPFTSVDDAVAWHYGDPFAEQRLLASGAGAVDMSHRGVITISGAERLEFLNSITTQLLLPLQAGESALTLDLSMNGFVLHELHVVDDGVSTWVMCEPDATSILITYLNRMKFRMQLEILDVSADWAVVWQPVKERHEEFLTWLSPFEWDSREVLVPRARLMEVVSSVPVGLWAYTAFRIAAGVPRQGWETDHHTIAHELGWINSAVHLNKGCYRGQETVSKVARMGKPPRTLRILHFDGTSDDLPPSHTDVVLDGVTVGFVGSAAHHYELGPIALAVIKRNVAEDSVLDVNGMRASQEAVVTL